MPRKGENIYKRKDGRWEGRYIKGKDAAGKSIRGYVYAKTYREVKAKLIEAVASDRNKANSLQAINYDSFESIAMEWFECSKSRTKLSTQNKYWNLLHTYILPVFGKEPLHLLTHECIESYCNMLLEKGGTGENGLSPKTVSDILSVIRIVLQFASQKGKVISCDAKGIHIKKTANHMRILSRYEQEKLCQYLYANPDPYNLGILVSLFTGLRVGEVCALRWDDFSFSERTIYVHQTMQRVQDRSSDKSKTKVIVTAPKSACSIRIIPLPDVLISIIKKNTSERTGYFLTSSNQAFIEPRTMQNRFQRALKAASIEQVNYHTLRHTFATRCIECGFDVKSLSEILGHASVNITMNRYVHPSMEQKRENMQRLSDLIFVK